NSIWGVCNKIAILVIAIPSPSSTIGSKLDTVRGTFNRLRGQTDGLVDWISKVRVKKNCMKKQRRKDLRVEAVLTSALVKAENELRIKQRQRYQRWQRLKSELNKSSDSNVCGSGQQLSERWDEKTCEDINSINSFMSMLKESLHLRRNVYPRTTSGLSDLPRRIPEEQQFVVEKIKEKQNYHNLAEASREFWKAMNCHIWGTANGFVVRGDIRDAVLFTPQKFLVCSEIHCPVVKTRVCVRYSTVLKYDILQYYSRIQSGLSIRVGDFHKIIIVKDCCNVGIMSGWSRRILQERYFSHIFIKVLEISFVCS
ncbi:hypothetical protein C0J52_09782, partial [Blattella germanica]